MSEYSVKVFGPLIWMFMYRLHLCLHSYSERDTTVLFATRAGIRIHQLYVQWLNSRNLNVPTNLKVFCNSRLLSYKLLYKYKPSIALELFDVEYKNIDLHDILKALHLNEKITLDESRFDNDSITLSEFIASKNLIAKKIHSDLMAQAGDYDLQIRELLNTSKNVILVDSGWSGTSQSILENIYTEFNWIGLYFGKTGKFSFKGMYPREMRGLIFDSQYYDDNNKETSILVHRHLIESFFEPPIPSFNKPDDVRFFDIQSISQHELHNTHEFDLLYKNVLMYINKSNHISLSEAYKLYSIAIDLLHDIVCYPSVQDVSNMCGKPRSHDIGRIECVEVVIPATDRFEGDNKYYRIENAIWKTGQAALEARDVLEARILQKRVLDNCYKARNECIDYLNIPKSSVAVITRTKDRPVLLERAARSVSSQIYKNYYWVVVNDGGNFEEVIRIIKSSGVDESRIVLCNNKTSQGMEAASNLGISSVHSDYIVIHDDDDSWEPDFLLKTVSFLESNRALYQGVITGTTYISEKISRNQVEEVSRVPYNDWVRNVQFSELVVNNFFAPIAFVFSRKVYDTLNGFDEKLQVLGDWDFNLRFLLEADIGVINEPLANYHHRDVGLADFNYSNSVIGSVDKHQIFNAVVRNKYIRLAGSNPKYSILANAIISGYNQSDTRNRLNA